MYVRWRKMSRPKFLLGRLHFNVQSLTEGSPKVELIDSTIHHCLVRNTFVISEAICQESLLSWLHF